MCVFPVVVSVDSSPGPRYHTGAKVTRFGRMDTPSYSILGRGKRSSDKGNTEETIKEKENCPNQFIFMCIGDPFQTPGPGAYSPEKAPPLNSQRRPPSYTISTRTRYRSVDAVPAPNR